MLKSYAPFPIGPPSREVDGQIPADNGKPVSRRYHAGICRYHAGIMPVSAGICTLVR